MGYGGAAKKITRVVVPVAVGVMTGGNPIAVGLASAATNKATGGSWKEAAISGVTSYVGASVAQGISADLTQAGDIAQASALSDVGMDSFAAGAVAPASTFVEVLANVPGIEVMGSTVGQMIGGPGAEGAAGAAGAAPSGATDLTVSGLSDAAYANVANSTIGELGGAVAGGMVADSLNMTVQAALMDYPEYLIDSGLYTAEEVAMLTEQMRQSRLSGIQSELTGEITDPGVTGPQTWSDILGQGLGIIEEEAFPGGGDVPESQFAGIFEGEGIGQQAARRGLQAGVEETFPTITAGESPFMPLSEQAVANILDPQREEAQRLGAIQQARGNLSPYGGQQFSEYIQGQDVGAREAVGRAGETARSEAMSELRAPYETAMAGARLYTPGGELPYDRQLLGEERAATIEERGAGIPGRAAEIAGTGLYDPIGAMSAAGRVQGVVSGAPQQQAMLDVLAARRRGDRDRRGIGSGGVF
jgi:hypothetical protein